MASRFVSLRFSRAFFSHAGSFMSQKGGYVTAGGAGGGGGVVAEVWQDHIASPEKAFGECVSQRHFCGPTLYFCWEEKDEEGLEGWRKGIGQKEAACGCNRRSRRGMILIHVFHFQPLFPSSDIYSPPVISPDFSLLLQLASELSALHPFTHYPPSLVVYSFALFYLSIYHTYPWCTWAVAVSCRPTVIIILVALSDYSFQWEGLGPQEKSINIYIYWGRTSVLCEKQDHLKHKISFKDVTLKLNKISFHLESVQKDVTLLRRVKSWKMISEPLPLPPLSGYSAASTRAVANGDRCVHLP